MSPLTGLVRRAELLRRDALLLEGAGVLAGIAFLVSLYAAADPAVYGVGWALLLILWAVQPAGALGPALLPAAPLAWWWGGADPASWWSLPAALALLVLIAVTAIVTGSPDGTALAPATVRRYARRSAAVAVLTLVVWLLGRILSAAEGEHRSLTVLAFAALAAALVLIARHLRADPGAGEHDPD